LNVISSPDSKYLIVTNNGLAAPTFSIIDVASWKIKNTMALAHAWYGLVWHPDGTRLYSAGANQNNVQEFSYVDGTLTRARTFSLPTMTGDTFAGGLAISRDGRTLYVTRLFAMTVSAIDVSSGQVVKTVTLRAEPYTSVLSTDGPYLFVSLWGGSSVVVLDAQSLTVMSEIPVGEHPNALVPPPDGTRLFVACGNSADLGDQHDCVRSHRADLLEPVPGFAAGFNSQFTRHLARWEKIARRAGRQQCGRRDRRE
jgi:YVTN family beta-propeller protein